MQQIKVQIEAPAGYHVTIDIKPDEGWLETFDVPDPDPEPEEVPEKQAELPRVQAIGGKK